MNIEIEVGDYTICKGDEQQCSHPEQLWIYSGKRHDGMEVRVKDLEAVLDKFYKDYF